MPSETSVPVPEALAEAFAPVPVRAGRELFAQGEPAEALYLLETGWVRLYRLSPRGREMTTLVLDPGELFGEEALLPEGRYGQHADALTAVRVLRLERAGLLAAWEASPEVRRWVLARLVRRLRATQDRYREHRFRRVLPRLAALLVEQMQPGQEGLEVHLSHEQMSHRLGAGRDTVTRALGALAMRDLLEINYRRVVVLNPDAVRRLASGSEDDDE
ncbi:MAG TPA: Crp/Fnr family transcriptional regulator [Oceanithermus profundus]|uniref:Crp/Fnr family transcriptional regulator n=1 Tax=Oceanithermus profundus TaxID=187137 RepID=A0A7C4ZGQ0_9DEIN|nr:Crp/Fnr family transcriptional regulator [Oceanithermus profundus]